jgi:VWFA-related protein
MCKRLNCLSTVQWLFLLLFLLNPSLLQSQESQQQPQQPLQQQTEEQADIKEYVEVVNVEMILRALRKGQPVGGLKKTDFRLMENGKELKITSFTEVRRKIGENEITPSTTELAIPDETAKLPEKRFFLIYFWLEERDLKYRESLDYFFKNVFREGDRVILVTKRNAFPVTKEEEIAPAVQQLEQAINRSSDRLKRWMRSTTKEMQRAFDRYKSELEKTDVNEVDYDRLRYHRNNVKHTFDHNWEEYRLRYLTSNVTRLMTLAKELGGMDVEKWGLVFYQHNVFPTYNTNRMELDLARADWKEKWEFEKMILPINLRIKKPDKALFHIKRIQQAFIRANATFHLLLPDMRTKFDPTGRNLILNDVYSDWKEAFRQISQATGGEIVGGNKLKASLQKVVEREDIYYRITFRPQKIDKKNRHIEIKPLKKGLKIFHVSRVHLAAPAAK